MEQNYTIGEIIAIIGTWQGHTSHIIFSIYAIRPQLFTEFLRVDPGIFLLSNMLYGNAIHIFTRPAMKKIRPSVRLLFSIHGSYSFSISSLVVFLALGEKFAERPVTGIILSYMTGKILYSLFYTYLYFVDKCANPQARRDSVLDFMFED